MSWKAAVLAVVALVPVPAYAEQSPFYPGPRTVSVVRVIDGDTAVAADTSAGILGTVRILGIDTPEKNSTCAAERLAAKKAAEEAERFLARDGITLERVRKSLDKYRRTLAYFTAGSENLSEHMIAAGLARPYSGEKRQPWCDEQGNLTP